MVDESGAEEVTVNTAFGKLVYDASLSILIARSLMLHSAPAPNTCDNCGLGNSVSATTISLENWCEHPSN